MGSSEAVDTAKRLRTASCPRCARPLPPVTRRTFTTALGGRKTGPCPRCRATLRLRGPSNLAYQVACWLWLGSLLLPFLVPLGAACIVLLLMPPLCLGLERLRRFELAPGHSASDEPTRERQATEGPFPSPQGASFAPDDAPEEPPLEIWSRVLSQDGKGWVVFRHGTCVVVADPSVEPAEYATRILREWGPVHAGTSAGDFAVTTLVDVPGWIVTGHHPDVLNHVSPEDVGGIVREAVIGLLGRSARDADAEAPEVVHVERVQNRTT